jgi:cell fate regulator YaaT (PSP1 superfamily)
MNQLAYVKLQEVGKHFQYQCLNEDYHVGDQVIVETSSGIERGVISRIIEAPSETSLEGLKEIIRHATIQDQEKFEHLMYKAKEALAQTKSLVSSLQLDMKLETAYLTLDEKKLMISYESDSRVDFRELVKELSYRYHTRIEMRQIGPRDVAKIRGGIGPCGLMLCCTTFIGDFETISIKMAKNQNLSLNPQKISGLCGKLLCCIQYEDSTYEQLKKEMPNMYDLVETENGQAKVIDMNYISKQLKLLYQDGRYVWQPLSDIKQA